MKRFSALVFAFLFLALAPFAQAKTYVNGIDANYPPFSFIDEQGNAAGFDIESMNWIANKMGFEVQHTPINWDGIIPALQAKKIDMICSGMSISEERKQAVNFSEPYYSIKKYIAVKNGSNLTAEEVFKGKYTLGVQRGTNEHELLQSRIDNEKLAITLRLYDSPPMSVEDLLNGRIDAIAIDSAPAEDAVLRRTVSFAENPLSPTWWVGAIGQLHGTSGQLHRHTHPLLAKAKVSSRTERDFLFSFFIVKVFLSLSI